MTITSSIRLRGVAALAVSLAAVGVLPAGSPARAADIDQDRVAFLAATGAGSATGPLPDLGGSIASTGPITVGSVTFALAPGGNSITIGASGTGVEPDWYPQTPGHDLAMGFENLEVRLASPVYALGFDLVEPNTTMPSWGGAPIDSPFTLTLFSGDAVVRDVVFDVPDDVLAFQGIWSDVAFDRAWIIDSTGNHDDEFFGEFYTGTVPGPPTSSATVATTGSAVPAGDGVITGFPGAPDSVGGLTAFVATGSSGSSGVYLSGTGGDVARVADLTSPVPAGTGAFTGFRDVAVAGDVAKPEGPPIRVAFLGSGQGQDGVYASALDVAGIPGNPVRVADLATPIPDGSGTFTAYDSLVAAAAPAARPEGPPVHVAFLGRGVEQAGAYVGAVSGSSIPGNPVRVADLSTEIPGGTGTFERFEDLAIGLVAKPDGPPIRAAFLGAGQDQEGVYLSAVGDTAIPGNPVRVADLTTPVPGGAGSFSDFSDVAVTPGDPSIPSDPVRVAFIGSGAGQQGVFVSKVDDATIPGNPVRVADLSTPVPGGTGTFTAFTALSASGRHVAFLGEGSGGQAGIYRASTLTKVIAVGDRFAGRTVAALQLGPSALDGPRVAFGARFTDGTAAVLVGAVDTYRFAGFSAPVDNPPTVNTVQAGRAVPLTFSLDGDHGLHVLAPGSPTSRSTACDTAAPLDPVELTGTAGASGLSYDENSDRYTYVWKTDRAWARTCRTLTLTLRDGTAHQARFSFR